MELSIPDIQGNDPCSSVLKQAVRESSCGGPDIQERLSPDIDGEGLQSGLQFLPAPADIGRMGFLEYDGRCVWGEISRLVHPQAVDLHQTRHNHSFCLFAAFHEAAFDKQEVQPGLMAFWFVGKDLVPPSKFRIGPDRIFLSKFARGRVQ